jgi:uncharacterized phage protein (TIGR02216 family)
MPNRYRGEIDAELGGRRRTLVLTLGALAELESAFGAVDLMALAERFGTGRLSARDLVRIIAAGLRGAGDGRRGRGDDDTGRRTGLCAHRGRLDRRDVRRWCERGSAMKPFPWSEAIGFGLGVLQPAPDAFGRMPPRALAHAIVAVRGRTQTPIDRAGLDDLMQRFPDTTMGKTSHGG